MYLLVSRARLVLLTMGTGWRVIWRAKRLSFLLGQMWVDCARIPDDGGGGDNGGQQSVSK